MAGSTIVFDPTAAPGHDEPRQLRQSLNGLAGKTVGFIDNAKPNFHFLVDDLAELFTSKYGVSAILKCRKRGAAVPAPDAAMKEFTEKCDLVITGSGD